MPDMPDGSCRLVQLERDPGLTWGYGDVWWYVQAKDTNVVLGIKNPRMEWDDDDGKSFIVPKYDKLHAVDGATSRELTEEEMEEYHTDVIRWLRHQDWDA